MDATETDCIECGEPFLPKHYNQKLCSAECRKVRCRERYGITFKQAKELLAEQGGICPICLNKLKFFEKKGKRHTVIDHCHVTNTVRGILCNACNLMLGSSKENPLVLQRAIEYLQ